jgi:hypothetical protein
MIWTEQELNGLKLDFNILTKIQLEEKYHRKFDTIRKIANKFGLHRKTQRRINISYEKLLEISNDKTKTILNYCKELNISHYTLMNRLYENSLSKIDKRKYQVDENYFENLNTEDKNYWYGFILADGHIREQDNMLQIDLNNKDIEILIKFKEHIKFEGNIEPNNKRQSVKIRIFSEKIFNDLIKLGCIQDKTRKLEFLKIIKNEFIHHFLRGYFDGDGCIYGKSHNIQFKIYSTLIFNLKYQQILIEKLNLNITKINKRKGCYSLSYSGRKQIKKIYDFLYKDATIYLNRKKIKFENIINKLI